MTVLAIGEFLSRAVEALDEGAVRRRYLEQDQFVVLDGLLPGKILERWDAELEALLPHVHRNYIPGHKQGGSVGFQTIVHEAPTIYAVYRSPVLLAFLERVVGVPITTCPPTDPHGCALYAYTRHGDSIGFHYDRSYYRGARYTLLFGLRDQSSSRLVCRLHTRNPRHPVETLELRLAPGTAVAFNGDKVLHAVTPLGEGEHRYVITMEYVTSTEMSPFLRFISDMKDAVGYFGFREVFLRRRGRAGSSPDRPPVVPDPGR